LNNSSETNGQKRVSIHICNILATPSLLYGCEIWTSKQRDIREQKTAEMKFTIPAAGYSLIDDKRNEDILEEREVDTVEKKIAQHKQK
jgi:hypothetical protein